MDSGEVGTRLWNKLDRLDRVLCTATHTTAETLRTRIGIRLPTGCVHTVLPTQGHVDDQDIVNEESRNQEETTVTEHLRVYDALRYYHQGKAAVIFEDPLHHSSYEELVNGSDLGSGTLRTLGDEHGDLAVLAPAKSREKDAENGL